MAWNSMLGETGHGPSLARPIGIRGPAQRRSATARTDSCHATAPTTAATADDEKYNHNSQTPNRNAHNSSDSEASGFSQVFLKIATPV